jgi:hypothetical protein
VVSVDHGSLPLSRDVNFEPDEKNRLIYGASWQSENVAVLCSFYEKKLYICKIP